MSAEFMVGQDENLAHSGGVKFTQSFIRALSRPSAAVGLSIVSFWILVAILAPLIAPYGPNDLVGRALQSPSAAFLIGTDDLGRDVLSRVEWGARVVLVLAPMAVLIAEIAGALIGLFSGDIGGGGGGGRLW